MEGSDPSRPLTHGRRRGLAQARAITEGCAVPTRGNRVYSPGGLRSAKPASDTFSKYAVEDAFPRGEKEHGGSDSGLCMLRLPTTRRGMPPSRKRDSGRTE